MSPTLLLQSGFFRWVSCLSVTQFPHPCGVSPGRSMGSAPELSFHCKSGYNEPHKHIPWKRDALVHGKPGWLNPSETHGIIKSLVAAGPRGPYITSSPFHIYYHAAKTLHFYNIQIISCQIITLRWL